MRPQDIASQIHADPRGRSEDAWLDTLDFLAGRLGEATSAHLHIGTYWCSDEIGHSFASIISRVRARCPLPGTDSDYWEGALCYTGSNEGAHADAYLFPFRNGCPVVSRGFLAADAELDEFRWWQLDEGRFVDRGWSYPDGPGEWGWVKKPGDEYWQSVNVRTAPGGYQSGVPIFVGLSNIVLPTDHRARQQSSARISIIHANRDRENTNLYPWGVRPPRRKSQYALPITEISFQGTELQVDLSRFGIRGGWIPGQYHVAIRVQNCRNPGDWSYSSDISAPFRITVCEGAS